MTDIKQVSDWALTIAAEAAGSKLHHYERMADDNRLAQSIEAHARAIEQHEAFRQEVSDAVEVSLRLTQGFEGTDAFKAKVILERFIIPPADPVAEAFRDAFRDSRIGEIGGYHEIEQKFHKALKDRGLELSRLPLGGA